MAESKSELEQIVTDIRKSTKQIAVNKVDEVRVMRAMLNDPDYTIGIYDRTQGYVGQRNPHTEAVSFIKGIIAGSTGLESKDAQHLAENYEFTKKDANYLLSNMRDFLNIYTTTGRKINIMQNARTEAYLFTKDVSSSTKFIPDKENVGTTKKVQTAPYTKLVSSSKAPKYNENE